MFRPVLRFAAKPASGKTAHVCTRLLKTSTRHGQEQRRPRSQTASKLAALAGFAGTGIIAGEVWINSKKRSDNTLTAAYLSKQLQDSRLASSPEPPREPTTTTTTTTTTDTDTSFRYDMSHPRRGLAIIINNQHFNASTQMEVREGSEVDQENLSQVLMDLGFDVRVYTDLTCGQMRRVLRKVAAEDHSDSDCLLVSVLSHGYQGEQVYGVDGLLHIHRLSRYFKGENCKTLIGKPKLFIIQACQGERLMEGVTLTSNSVSSEGNLLPVTLAPTSVNTVSNDENLRPQTQTLPSGADFLYFHSVSQGYYSWRNIRRGSWLIQAFCKVLREDGYSGLEIMQLLTKVNRQVATEFESLSPDEKFNKKKQIPCIMSMLTKELYFTQKLPPTLRTESV